MGESGKDKYFVIDSSFILAYVLPDEHSSFVESIFEQFINGDLKLYSSTLLPFEVFNCLRTAVLRNRVSVHDAGELGASFLRYDIVYEEISFSHAFPIALKHALSMYDASYLFLSQQLRFPLLSFDKHLQKFSGTS